ncbi:MAG: aldehyde ferredoxin oxidoreductase family protein [Proteobacteria bacterium]|nr:aldehyde ferredoxin oxidoreductase family protein [Pseudomonadota bacterium]
MSGNFNKLLKIDLGSEKIETIDIDPEMVKSHVGGSALAARLFFESDGYQYKPLQAESPLYIMTGPMVGTNFPGSSRFVLCARSPLTGIWGESASGGFWGAELKKVGYDGIVIEGKASSPCYVIVEDSNVSIVEAADLWGLDTYQSVDTLKGKHQGKRPVRVITIGPAGENLVKYAAVCNDKAHYFGRTGMGAVMGSKNLKAIVVRGNGKVPVAEQERYREARKAALAAIKESMISASFHDLGTAAAMDMGMMTGDVPIKNWSLGEDYEMAAALGGPAIHETILKGRAACYACPIGCKPVVAVDHPKYAIAKGPGPEYETCATFGTMIMNDDLNAVAHANELCNRLGLDTITCGATIAFMMDCYTNGLLSSQDLDEVDLAWGNVDAAIEMIHKIAKREGFGDRAAEGSQALAASIGEAAEKYVVTVKGLELPMHDPRGFHGLGLAYMNSNRGACHLQHAVQAVEQGMVAWPEAGLEEDYPATESTGKAKMVCISENIGQMANAACVCHFVHWAMGLDKFLDGFNAVTGYGFGMDEFIAAGRRAWVLKRALNNMMGVTSADDRLPQKVLTPTAEGAAAGSIPDEELMRKEYYEIRGLDERGFPTLQLLESTDLEFLNKRLENYRRVR